MVFSIWSSRDRTLVLSFGRVPWRGMGLEAPRAPNQTGICRFWIRVFSSWYFSSSVSSCQVPFWISLYSSEVELIADFCGGSCALAASSCAGYAGEVEEVVVDAGLVKPFALDQDVFGQIAFVHEA